MGMRDSGFVISCGGAHVSMDGWMDDFIRHSELLPCGCVLCITENNPNRQVEGFTPEEETSRLAWVNLKRVCLDFTEAHKDGKLDLFVLSTLVYDWLMIICSKISPATYSIMSIRICGNVWWRRLRNSASCGTNGLM